MIFKTNLLTAAIAASLLTACGGSSDSSDPVVELEPADPAPVEPAPTEPTPDALQYSLSDSELLNLGKIFIRGLDAQAGELATALGATKGGIIGTVDDLDEEYRDSVEQGFSLFLESVGSLGHAASILRDAAENGFMPTIPEPEQPSAPELAAISIESPTSPYQFNVEFEEEDEFGNDVTYIFGKNAADQIVLNASSSYSTEGSHLASSEVKLTYIELPDSSDGSHQVSISSTLVESYSGMYVRVDNAEFTANHGDEGLSTTIELNVEKILVVLDEVTAMASIKAELVVGGAEAESGTYQEIEEVVNSVGNVIENQIELNISHIDAAPAVAQITGVGIENDGETLNLASFEITDLRVELSSGEYFALDSLLFEDADAADYLGKLSGNAIVAKYEINDAEDELVLSNEFGSTTYTYVAAQLDEASYTAAKLFCVADVANYKLGAPYIDVDCDEEGVTTGSENLLDILAGSDVYTGSGRPQEVRTFDTEGGEFNYSFESGIDSRLEPVTFSVEASGELGLAGGLKIPYQLNLNHPGAYNYQAKAIIGTVPALTAVFSTQQEDIVVSAAVPFIPADAAYAPTGAVIAFSYNYYGKPEYNEEAEVTTFGSLTVNGLSVATLVRLENFNDGALSEGQYPYVLQYVDGSYPKDGGLFSTVNDMVYVDCPESDLKVSSMECLADQSGVIDTSVITELFFDGLGGALPEEEERPEPK